MSELSLPLKPLSLACPDPSWNNFSVALSVRSRSGLTRVGLGVCGVLGQLSKGSGRFGGEHTLHTHLSKLVTHA